MENAGTSKRLSTAVFTVRPIRSGGNLDRESNHVPTWVSNAANELYLMIENVLVQEFYNRNAEGVPEAWISKARQSMKRLTVQFSSDRMVQDFVEKAYLPAAEKHRDRTTKECKLAKELRDWRQAVRLNWRGMRFVNVNVSESNEN